MYAIIETGGKQTKVEAGKAIYVEKLDAEVGSTYTFDHVCLISDGKTVKVGAPYVKDATVTAEVLEQGRGKKIIVYKFKRKKDYHKKQGHRQAFTKLLVKEINK